MRKERQPEPTPKKPEEVFGLNDREILSSRINMERFKEILADDQTKVHKILASSNNYGEFLFVTASRPGDQGRISMTFFGLGYHEHRERWLTEEWFWYQSNLNEDQQDQQISKEEAQELLEKRLAEIRPYIKEDIQTERGKLFELLADITDEDGALAEMEDIEPYIDWILPSKKDNQEIPPPVGENLLDKESREKLPPLYSGEKKRDWTLWHRSNSSHRMRNGPGMLANLMGRIYSSDWLLVLKSSWVTSRSKKCKMLVGLWGFQLNEICIMSLNR